MALFPERFFQSGPARKFFWAAVRQELACSFLAVTGGWERVARRAARFWTEERAASYLQKHGVTPVLLAADGREAMRLAIASGLSNREDLMGWGADVRARRFGVLNVPVPQDGGWPWRSDWRVRHVFPQRDFRSYAHDRPGAQDVKYPWELSRLWFLQPVMQKALLEEHLAADISHLNETLSILKDWRRENPLASSVNWDPTEAAMRGLGLVVLFDLFLLARPGAAALSPLLAMLTEHGEFIFRTVGEAETHDHKFAARIVALLAIGSVLAGWWPQALEWQMFAAERIEEEILTQFLPDGVCREKSAGFQRLTTELFLLAALLQDKRGQPMGYEALQRLHDAARFMAAATQPDGWLPAWGDADEARIFAFDPALPRNPAPLLGLAAVFFNDGRLKPTVFPPELSWLLGVAGVRRWQVLSREDEEGGHFFESGGIMIARRAGSYLFFCAGEMGAGGPDRHRHNDLLSFVLHLSGQPFLVDPGTYALTPDARTSEMFRGTRYHNGLMIDGEEITPFSGVAGLAHPYGQFFAEQKGFFQMQAAHDGYRRLADPVTHWREIVFSPEGQRFLCKDRLEASGRHKVERLFHFAPGIVLEKSGSGLIARLGEVAWQIVTDQGVQAKIFPGKISPGYGLAVDASVLLLSNETSGNADLFIDIFPINK